MPTPLLCCATWMGGNCSEPVHTLKSGLCRGHLMQQRKGKPFRSIRKYHLSKKELVYRFLRESSVDPISFCCVPALTTQPNRYPVTLYKGKLTRIGCLVLEVFCEPRPDTLVMRHLCHNKGCINPLHIEWGSISENGQDCYNRTDYPHAGARLTHEEVREIRSLKGVAVQKEVAKRFNTTASSVSRIWSGERWSWLS